MAGLYDQTPKLGPIGLRAGLLRIHTDLFKVHRRIRRSSAYYPPELTPLEKLVIALEDRRFMRHAGIDAKSVVRETVKALALGRSGGASTIDMQFVRTATGYKKRTLGRKLYECLLSILIQYRYSKIVILRSYLSCAYFGSHLQGADRASMKIFGCRADSLNIEQAAYIASMLVYPRPLSAPAAWDSRVRRRANYGVAIYVGNKESFDKFPG